MTLNADRIKELFEFLSATIQQNEAYLCELDSVVGDGDHGVTMSRGFRCAEQAISDGRECISSYCADFGKALMGSMGGAIGPIYGTLFEAFSKETQGCTEIGTAELSKMFEKGLVTVKMVADVQEGQKTMVDALSPATHSLKESAEQDKPLHEALRKAAECAEAGAKATLGMVAKKGRARFLKEKSLGHQDAGATSMAIIIRAMSTFAADTIS